MNRSKPEIAEKGFEQVKKTFRKLEEKIKTLEEELSKERETTKELNVKLEELQEKNDNTNNAYKELEELRQEEINQKNQKDLLIDELKSEIDNLKSSPPLLNSNNNKSSLGNERIKNNDNDQKGDIDNNEEKILEQFLLENNISRDEEDWKSLGSKEKAKKILKNGWSTPLEELEIEKEISDINKEEHKKEDIELAQTFYNSIEEENNNYKKLPNDKSINEFVDSRFPRSLVNLLSKKRWEKFKGINEIENFDEWVKKIDSNWEDAQNAIENGWKDIITNIEFDKNNRTFSHELVNDKIKKEISGLKLIHKRLEVEKVLGHLINIEKINNLEDLRKIKLDNYSQASVPDEWDLNRLKKEKNDKEFKLFKEAFEKEDKDHGLSDEEIKKWLKSENTSLARNGIEERKAHDNGWKISDIWNLNNSKKVNYKGVTVDATEIKKDQIDSEIKKFDDLIAEINTKNTFFELKNFRKDKEENINSLKEELLPNNKNKNEVEKAILLRRNTFKFKINVKDNEKKGDGLTSDELKKALKLEEEKYVSKKYNPLNHTILNQLVEEWRKEWKELDKQNKDKDKDKKVSDEDLSSEDYIDLEDWLKTLGGYKIDDDKDENGEEKKWDLLVNDWENNPGNRVKKTLTGTEIIKQENEWTKADRKDLQGTYLLPYSYVRNDFDIDAISQADGKLNSSIFAEIKEVERNNKNKETIKIKILSQDKGTLAIATGVGKTSKFVNCLAGRGINVVLVCPNEALLNDTFNSHNSKGWLQKENSKGERYKCVTHGVAHNTYPVEKNNLVYWENHNEKPCEKGGKKGLSILQYEYLFGYIVRADVKTDGKHVKEPSPPKIKEFKTNGVFDENFAKHIKEIKEKLIPKEETIIIVDETHFTDAKFQVLQKLSVEKGYNVLLMSATITGKIKDPATGELKPKPFSITTSHPRKVYLTKRFQPEYLKDEKGEFLTKNNENGNNAKIEKWEKQKTLIFLPSTEDEWEIDATGKKKKDLQIKWGGLTRKQKEILDDNNIAYVVFDRTNAAASSGITFGMPEGSVFFVSPDYEMGFTFDVDNVILTGKSQLTTLGHPRATAWVYDTPQIIPLTKASFAQQIGRVSRIRKGYAYVLNKEISEIDVNSSRDLSYKFVFAALTGDIPTLKNINERTGMRMGDGPEGINFLRLAFALPNKFGLKPEEILIGVSGIKPVYPTFENKLDKAHDEELWNRHLRKPTPPKLDIDRAKQVLFLIVYTCVNNQFDLKTGLQFDFENDLIKDIWSGTENEKKIFNKEKAISEIRKVLNKLIAERIGNVEKTEFNADEKSKFEEVVALHRFANGVNIDIVNEYKDKDDPKKGKKETKTLQIHYYVENSNTEYQTAIEVTS